MKLAFAALSLLALAACLSSNPALPPVRLFDPMPMAAKDAADAGQPGVGVRVDPGAAIRTEFVLRVAEREVVVDEQHRWIAPPEQLLAEVLRRRLSVPESGPTLWRVRLERFELDLTASPTAVVHWQVQEESPGSSVAPWHDCHGRAAAASRDPADLAAAMAEAIEAAMAAMSR